MAAQHFRFLDALSVGSRLVAVEIGPGGYVRINPAPDHIDRSPALDRRRASARVRAKPMN